MVMTSIEEANYLAQFTLEELTRSLLSNEAPLNQTEKSLKNVFNTQTSLNKAQGRGRR